MGILKTVDTGLAVLSAGDFITPILFMVKHKRHNQFTMPADYFPWIETMFEQVEIPMLFPWLHLDSLHFAVPEGMAPKAKAVVAAALEGMPDDAMVAKFGPKQKIGKKRAGGLRQILQELRDL